jgi:hypothetical protein
MQRNYIRESKLLAFLLAGLTATPAVAGNVLNGLTTPTSTGSQLSSTRDAASRNRNASNLARNAGRNSIGKGTRHMRHGKSHHNSPEIKTGAFQVAQGLLGLLASAAASNISDRNDDNGDRLEAITGSGASFGADSAGEGRGGGEGTAQSNLGNSTTGNSTGAGVGFDPEDLANPELKSALALINDEFGIPSKTFLTDLANGRDPKDIFTKAEKNPMTMAEANEAYKASGAGMSDGASTLANIASAANSAKAEDPSANQANTKGSALRDALNRRIAGSEEEDETAPELSDDVKAALAAQAAEQAERARLDNLAEMNLFQVVHMKYREREKHLRWPQESSTEI